MTVIKASPARPRGPASPCPLSLICWPSASPAGILTSTSLPVGSRTRFLAPLAASASVDRERGSDIAARLGREVLLFELEVAASPARARAAPENMSLRMSSKPPKPRPPPAAARALKSPGPIGEGLEPAFAEAASASAASGAEPFEALEARLAFGIDLAAVEGLALLGVADDLVSGVELGEAARRLRVVLIGVRVKLLGKLPERALDLRGARAFGNPQNLIGVAHRRDLQILQFSS